MKVIKQQDLKTEALIASLPFQVGQEFEVLEVGITPTHEKTGFQRKAIWKLVRAHVGYHQGVWLPTLTFETEDKECMQHPTKDKVAVMCVSPEEVEQTSADWVYYYEPFITHFVERTFTKLPTKVPESFS